MFNIVTEKENYPAAVLIRGAKIIQNSCLVGPLRHEASRQAKLKIKKSDLDGPGKVTKFLHIDKSFNGHDLTKGEKLWLELPERRKRVKIETTPRIGINYAKHCKEWKWNFRLN
jgi:3-methyladenine DNA glycosylase Mpg